MPRLPVECPGFVHFLIQVPLQRDAHVVGFPGFSKIDFMQPHAGMHYGFSLPVGEKFRFFQFVHARFGIT